MQVFGGDQVRLLDVIVEKVLLPVVVLETAIVLGRLDHRLAVVTKETQHRALPQRQVVLPKLELHRGEFRRVGEQLAHHLVERLGNTELVTECRDAARPLARDEVGQEFTAASRDLGIGPRELGRIKRRPGFECRHGGSPEIRGLFSCA